MVPSAATSTIPPEKSCNFGVVSFYRVCKNDLILKTVEGAKEVREMQYPLSDNEHAAMTRYLCGVRKQLQDVSDLFTARYGRNSSIAEIAVKTLVSATLLEHELMLLEGEREAAEEFDGLPQIAVARR
jgi:hypothetical protein